MKDNAYRIGAFWGARRENSDEIASRLLDCFSRLRRVHPMFGDWRDRWKNDKEWAAGPKTPWQLDLQSLTRLVDSRAAKLRETGFTLGGWTGGWEGDNDCSVSASMTVGNHAQHMAPNHFMLELPPPTLAPGLYEPGVLRAAAEAVVDPWQPWWANVTSSRLLDAQQPPQPRLSIRELDDYLSRPRDARTKMPTVGWLTYLDERHFDNLSITELEAVVTVHHGNHGTWLTLAGDPLSVTGEDALAAYWLVQRPFHAHPFQGVEKDPTFDFDAYRARVLGIPHASMKYVVDGYAFDGYRDGRLQYIHPQYEFGAEKGELAPAQLKAVFLPLATEQLAFARGTKILWHFPQRQVVQDVQAALAQWGIEDIHVRYLA
ncbi:hypothetical protein Rhe02_52320 [Rhizocola hellebori]|uniref:Immunity protein 52 domain-containing protein n=1 Tax=Rhizocola hellebori TaxID=1392758 RepID=A0A8J3VI32_9ACTN|nr:Imm52 family immunity protein [Rhizocola hellebori]GIH07165.1 hypothetical protein Rhe02_52320 [Rhizocola hellebori]